MSQNRKLQNPQCENKIIKKISENWIKNLQTQRNFPSAPHYHASNANQYKVREIEKLKKEREKNY